MEGEGCSRRSRDHAPPKGRPQMRSRRDPCSYPLGRAAPTSERCQALAQCPGWDSNLLAPNGDLAPQGAEGMPGVGLEPTRPCGLSILKSTASSNSATRAHFDTLVQRLVCLSSVDISGHPLTCAQSNPKGRGARARRLPTAPQAFIWPCARAAILSNRPQLHPRYGVFRGGSAKGPPWRSQH